MKDKCPDVISRFAVAFEQDGYWVVNTIFGISVLTSYDPHDVDGNVRNDLLPINTREKRRLIRRVNPDFVMDVKFYDNMVLTTPKGDYCEPGYCEITGIKNGTIKTWRIKKGQNHLSKRLCASAPLISSPYFPSWLSSLNENASDENCFRSPICWE